MAIIYPVDVENTKWAIYDNDSGGIIARNQIWPRSDGGEIQGLDPNFIYCLQLPDEQPQYDSRTHFLQGDEVLDLDGNKLITKWNSLKRPLEERESAIDSREMEESERHIYRKSLQAQIVELTIALGIVIDNLEGVSLPPKKQAIFNKTKKRGIKLFRNRINAERLKEDEAAGTDPDQDSGWELEED